MTSSNIPDFLSYSATRHASDIFIIAGRGRSYFKERQTFVCKN